MRIKKFGVAAIAALSVMSCSDFDSGFDAVEFKHQELISEYSKNFVDRYGQIAPNHTWGFGEISDNSMSTRYNIQEKNMWFEKVCNVFHVNIPGWPDYYVDQTGTKNGGFAVSYGETSQYLETEPKELTDVVPAGDVTDEEIQYVSWWFRTHQYPGNNEVHLTDFFIQEISSDNDRNADGTIADEYTLTIKDDNKNVSDVRTEHLGKFTIDYLSAKLYEPTTDYDGSKLYYDHNKNFNYQHSNNLYDAADVSMSGENPFRDFVKSDGETPVTTNRRLIDFFTSSGTDGFRAHYPQDNTDRENYRLVHLTFTGKSGREYDGYYLGFDYEFYREEEWYEDGSVKKLGKRDYDGYYSNWILKVSAATPHVKEDKSYSRRVFCEDLGNTYDFDFNDVVFDVTYNTDDVETWKKLKYDDKGNVIDEDLTIDATITLRAAGGTLPIYVGVEPTNEQYEIHNLMGGNPSNTPINVGLGTTEGPIANYHVTLKSADPDDIDIYVVKNGKPYKLDKANKTTVDSYNDGKKGGDSAPQKICVPITVRWMKEMQQIETGYYYFIDYVQTLDPEMSAGSGDIDDLEGKDPEKWYNRHKTSTEIDFLY